jgi:ABC-type transporter Mla MlaB component
MYLNDSVKSFEFVLQGELTGDAVRSLEQAWMTATSILGGKDVFVDASALTAADADGMGLLCRMSGAGARLTAARHVQSPEFLSMLGVPQPSAPRHSSRPWMSGVLRLFRLSS